VLARILANDNCLCVPEGRMWVTKYPADKLPKAEKIYSPSVLAGMQAYVVVGTEECTRARGERVALCAGQCERKYSLE
jgi:hypothetical protein